MHTDTIMHNLQLTDDQQMVVDTVHKLVADAVAPKAQEFDEHRTFAREWFDGLAELGVFGLSLAEDKGGAGMGLLPYVAALESIGAHSGSLARLWIGQMQCLAALEVLGGGDLLDELTAGAKLGTYVGAEYGFRLVDGKLSGAAELVPAAMQADVLVVAADTGDGVAIVTLDASQCQRDELRALGLASSGCGRVHCDEVAVSVVDGDAGAAVQQAELVAWVGVAAAAVGGGCGANALSRQHAGERIAFGKPLLRQQAVMRKIVECGRALDAARQLTWHAARLADLGQDATDAAIQARLAAIEAMVLAADEGIQVHGGFGYTVEYHVERHYRDAQTFAVLDHGCSALKDRLAARQFA